MKNVEKAMELFNEQGYHCSQAVFGAFAEEAGLTEKQALKIGGCFGGGMNEGEVCGCVTGALMAIGLKYGQCEKDDFESRKKSAELCKEFYERFKSENGSCLCKELLGYDFSKEEDTKIICESKLYLKICPALVESAARILCEMEEGDAENSNKIRSIKVLGSGCKACHQLYDNAQRAVKAIQPDIETEFVTDMERVAAYGVMSTPALVLNEKVVAMGKVLKPDEIVALLHQKKFSENI